MILVRVGEEVKGIQIIFCLRIKSNDKISCIYNYAVRPIKVQRQEDPPPTGHCRWK